MGSGNSRACGGGGLSPEDERKMRNLEQSLLESKVEVEKLRVDSEHREKHKTDKIIELGNELVSFKEQTVKLEDALESKERLYQEKCEEAARLDTKASMLETSEERATKENAQLSSEVRSLQTQCRELREENTHLRSELEESRNHVQHTNRQVDELTTNLAKTIAGLDLDPASTELLLKQIEFTEAEQRELRAQREKQVSFRIVEKFKRAKEERDAAIEAERLEAEQRAREAQEAYERARYAIVDAEPISGVSALAFMELFSVRMVIQGAEHLTLFEDDTQPNAYCTVTVLGQTRQTQVVYGSDRPNWQQTFGFITEKMPPDLHFDVWDYDRVRGDARRKLGEVDVKLQPLFHRDHPDDGVLDDALDLANAASGSLQVQITCRRVPQTSLRWLSGYNHMEIAKVLRYASADLSSRERNGRTPLMAAAARNQPDVARTLLLAKADPEAQDNAGLNSLMYAAIYGYDDVASVLLDAEANVEAVDNLQRTPLILASKNGHWHIVDLLLEHDPDIEARDQDGLTALMVACIEGHSAIVKKLCEREAQLEQKTPAGLTALHIAAVRDYAEIAQTLLDFGAHVEGRDANGLTPLMIAAVRGNVNVVRVLIARHAELEATEEFGRTPLLFAAHMGRYDCTKILLTAGADFEHLDADGRDALQIALDNNHMNVCRLIQKVLLTAQQQRTPGGPGGDIAASSSNGHDDGADDDVNDSI